MNELAFGINQTLGRPDERALDLRAACDIVRRRMNVVAVVLSISLLAALTALAAISPRYMATAMILVDPSRKDLLTPSAPNPVSSQSESARIESEAEMVLSAETLIRVIHQEDLLFDPEFLPGARWSTIVGSFGVEPEALSDAERMSMVLANLRAAVSAERRGMTLLIAINARSTSPQRAAQLANALAAAHIQQQLEAKVRSVLVSRDMLDARISAANASLAENEAAFDRFLDNNFERIAVETGRADLAAMRRELTLAMASREALVAQIENGSGDIGALRAQMQAGQLRIADIREDLRRAVLDSALPADILTSLVSLQQSATTARSQYQTLLARVSELETQASLQVADSRLVSAATTPERPVFPNAALTLLLACVLGLCAGIGLAFVVENYLGGVISEEQLADLAHREVAAEIPLQRHALAPDGSDGFSVADTVLSEPLSPYSESLRRLRLSVDIALLRGGAATQEAKGRVIAVTSAMPGEGKTGAALSLARTYATSGKGVLLVDCDLRRPALHRQLGIEATNGLFDYLSGRNPTLIAEEVIVNDPISEGRVIVGAEGCATPTEQFLLGGRFQRMIAAARSVFDVVILDTPPVGVVVDGLYLAPLADVVVFLTKWSSTSQRDVQAALGLLERSKRSDTDIVLALAQRPANGRGYNAIVQV